jgi:hypothetical protein
VSQYVTLLGADQVQSAASRIASAAEEMRRAASAIDDSLSRHQRFLDDWLNRFETVLAAVETSLDAHDFAEHGGLPR